MRKILFILGMMAAAGSALADSYVTVEPVEVVPGKQSELTVDFHFDEGHTICNYQMEFQLPDGISVVGSDVTLGACHTGHTGSIVNNIAVVTSMNKILDGTSGMLLKITLDASDELTTGTTLTGTLHNVKLGQTNETSVNPEDLTFDINVVERLTVTLDEDATTVPDAAEGVNVRVKRTISANAWSTICLPFAMTAEQVKAAFGDDVQLGNLTGTESEFDDDDNVIGIEVSFSNASEIEANHPYIIKVSEAVTEFSVNDVNINANEEEAYIEYDNGKTGSRKEVYSGIYGTYHAGTVLDANTLFLNENKFWYSTGKTKMKAFRAYFAFLDVLSSAQNAGARIWLSFDVPSSVDHLTTTTATSNGYYTLQGQRVEQPGRGVYIRNGKKVIIK